MSDKQLGITSVLFRDDARKRLLHGMSIAADAVGCTLGPRGKTVLIQQNGAAPLVTKDGVTVSKSIKLKDPVERLGAELIREAALQTNEIAGDGTTTSTILTHSMVSEGLKLLTAGYSSLGLCKGINNGVNAIVAELKKQAKQIRTPNEIAQVGTVSANGDKSIGELIALAMKQVGTDGIVTVEDAKGMKTTMDVVEGMQFDRGYLSPYFVTNNDKMTATYENCRVLVTDRKISTLQEMIPILEAVVKSGQKLLIIAEDVEGEALNALVLNRVQANLPVVAIKAPGYGEHRHNLLSDICVLTGAKLVSSKVGLKLSSVTLDDLGTTKRVVVALKNTTIIGNGTTKDLLDDHINELKVQLSDISLSAELIDKLKERIARLCGGIAIIKVGGATEIEMVERKYRIEDALNATRAASDEGIVSGGGMALFNASIALSDLASSYEEDERAGLEIVAKACQAPLRKIVTNAGQSPDVVVERLIKNQTLSDIQYRGYNAATNQEVDMLDEGIIDPVKVTRCALQNAASVAVTFLSLDTVIYREEE